MSARRSVGVVWVLAAVLGGSGCAGGAAAPGARGGDRASGGGGGPESTGPAAAHPTWTRTATPGTDAAQVDVPEPRRASYVLKNGLTVQVVERGDRPVVSVRLVLPTGAAADADAAAGATAIAAVLFAERYEETPTGTRIVDEKTLRYKFAQKGVAFSVRTLQDATVVSLDGYAADVGEYLAELADAVKRPRLGRFTYLAVRTYLRERLEDAELGDEASFFELLEQRAFGAAHVYARPLSGTAASLGQLAIEDVQAASRRLFVPRGATLIVAGRVTAREVFGFAEESFGTWRGAAAKSPNIKVRPGAARKQVGYIPRVPASTLLFCATRSLGDLATSSAELDVMVSILGGTSESRLNRTLRERLGLTYGAFGTFIRRRGGNALMFCARLRGEDATDGVRAFLDVLDGHRTTPPTLAEVDAAKARLRGELDARREGVPGLVALDVDALVRGVSPEATAAALAAVTPDGVARVAATALDPSRLELQVAGEPHVARTAVQRNGLGKLVNVRLDGR